MAQRPDLTALLDILVRRGMMHAGQRQDVLNRGREQSRHLLLDRRAELRRVLGKQRVSYAISEIELIASFRFKRVDNPELFLEEETITEVVAKELGYPFVRIRPHRPAEAELQARRRRLRRPVR